ncbi:hypothetical protein HBA55_29485 [Pseudomaricurvus alkylphenolicus]|uniref:hypothetical protein n=1 Tax=Pseudomaricurvus alkylphenolicus TaxID=1306991 RepID=UPI00141E902C|nr:hypothetical protein [Pseudomaricurvus alkylphenolicus]NIB43771.1 hypothetical protein [Pseudomaricurvus alkylphenolicus]
MSIVKEKLEILARLKSAKKDFEAAKAFIVQRNNAERSDSPIRDRIRVWDLGGSNSVGLDSKMTIRPSELLEILERRIEECSKEIDVIQPVIDMAERVFKAEEKAA